MNWPLLICLPSFLLSLTIVHAAPGDVDSAFDPGSGIDGLVTGIFKQPDGKCIIVGGFSAVRGIERRGIARLNADGSSDATFKVDLGLPAVMPSGVALLADGRMYMYGGLVQVNGFDRPGIARLNSDGSLDPTFFQGMTGPNGRVLSANVLSDGRIIVAGDFDSINNTPVGRCARLNEDGSLDDSFFSGAVTSGSIATTALLANNEILIAGSFSTVQGVDQPHFARLNADGSVDTAFGGSARVTFPEVSVIVPLADGHILIGGNFSIAGGANRSGIARLNALGGVDSSFGYNQSGTANDFGQVGPVTAIVPQADGALVIAGDFTKVNGVARAGLARLDSSGQLDTSFAGNFSITNWGAALPRLSSLAADDNGATLIGGLFSRVNTTTVAGIARLMSDSTVDAQFVNSRHGLNGAVQAVAIQPATGKLLVAGTFDRYGPTPQNLIARLNLDGSRDATFRNPLTNFTGAALTVAVAPNGKIFVGGAMEKADVGIFGLARLAGDGTFEAWLNQNDITDEMTALAAQSDNKIIVGGAFANLAGRQRPALGRLTAAGALDQTFNPTLPDRAVVTALALQADGKILVAGQIGSDLGRPLPLFTRLNTNGAPDETFAAGLSGPNDWVTSIAPRGDKIIVSGWFSNFHDQPMNGLAHLNLDGTLDTSFAGLHPNQIALWALPQSDGKIVYGNQSLWFGSEAMRVNSNGSPDLTFRRSGPGVFTAAFQGESKMILAGDFGAMNGAGRDCVARIFTIDDPKITGFLQVNPTSFRLTGTTDVGATYIVEWSHDLAIGWTEYSRATTTDGSISTDISTVAIDTTVFFRIRRP